MKRSLIFFLCVGLTIVAIPQMGAAQSAAAVTRAESACGPAGVNFRVVPNTKDSTSSSPMTGKAQVYVIEEYRNPSYKVGKGPTLRIGMDGQWAGAVHHDSYLLLPINAGEHHFCTNWQSRFKSLSRLISLTSLTAEPGKTYYLRARVTFRNAWKGAPWYTLSLEPVNEDEARLLLAQRRQGDSSVQK